MGCGTGDCGPSGEKLKINESEKKELPTDGKIIQVTESATNKIKELMEKDGKASWSLKIEAMPGGCAGYLYNMQFVETPENGELVQEENGVKFILDKDSAQVLVGTKVDFVDNLQGSGFTFSNPNAKSTCSCGKSFA